MAQLFNVDIYSSIAGSTSSKGNQDKWLIDNTWIKRDDLGYESLAEVLCSLVLSSIDNFSFVSYIFCDIERRGITHRDCCMSRDCSKGYTLITLQRILESVNFNIDKLKGLDTVTGITLVNDVVQSIYKRDIKDYLCRIIYFDSLVLNEDRHMHNIHFLLRGSELLDAPLFDNGAALLSDLDDYPLITSDIINMRRVKSKPFSSSFSKQISGANRLGVEPLRIDYIKLVHELNNFTTDRYSNEIIDRCRYVLNSRLQELEGKAWLRI